MAETKQERTASWKARTTKTATALRKAGATVSLGGKRSIPTTARTPAEIRVAAYRAEHPERVVVDPVTGKHTRVDTRPGGMVATAPTSMVPTAREQALDNMRGMYTTPMGTEQQAQRLAAERERAAYGATRVAEARARPPGVTEPTYTTGAVETVYRPESKTLPELFMGASGVVHEHIERMDPQEEKGDVTQRLEDVTERMSRGFDILEEKTRLQEEGVVADTEAKAINLLTEKYLHATEKISSMFLGVPRAAEIGWQQPHTIPARTAELFIGSTVGATGHAVTDPVQFTMEAGLTAGIVKGAGAGIKGVGTGIKGVKTTIKTKPHYDPSTFIFEPPAMPGIKSASVPVGKKPVPTTPELLGILPEHIRSKVTYPKDTTLKTKPVPTTPEMVGLLPEYLKSKVTYPKDFNKFLMSEQAQLGLIPPRTVSSSVKFQVLMRQKSLAKQQAALKLKQSKSLVESQRAKYMQDPLVRIKSRTKPKYIQDPIVRTKSRIKDIQDQPFVSLELLKSEQAISQLQKQFQEQVPVQDLIQTTPTIPERYVPPPSLKTITKFEEMPPMPIPIPLPGKLDDKRKKEVVRDKRMTPGYAWNLANPIATLEQLMGGGRTQRTSSRTSRKKSTTHRRRK